MEQQSGGEEGGRTMYIMSEDGRQIINADFPERFCLAVKPDAALIVASYGDSRPPVTMGRYSGEDEARSVMGELLTALWSGQACYYMPASRLYAEEQTKYDARTKRKGGS